MEGKIFNRGVFGSWGGLINLLFLCKNWGLMIMGLVVVD